MINKTRIIRKSNQPFFSSDNHKLLADFTHGSTGAFREVYTRFRKPIQRLVSSRIKNSDVVEEIVQETFLKVFRYREHYNPKYEFSTWIWTIAKNLTLDYLTRSRGDPLDSKTAQESENELQNIVSDQKGIETILFERAERRTLFKMLKRLPKLQRRALLMRVLQGCSYDEIANSLKLSLSAVKSLIYRGKTTLQSSIKLDNAFGTK